MATIPNNQNTAGIPSQSTETLSVVNPSLVTGSTPALATVDMIVAASQDIPALSAVGLDGSGRLIPAVSGTTQAIGITVAAVVSPAGTDYIAAPVYRQGVLNPDAIDWPASYDTDAKKFAAFNGAPTPTSIIIRKPKAGSV